MYAFPTDVAARLGRDLTATETLLVEPLLEDATAVVVGYLRRTYTYDTVPETVTGVVAKMVARSLLRSASPGGGMASQEATGPFSVSFPAVASSGDVWLSAADKLALRPYRLGGGMVSVALGGERYDTSSSSSSA